MTIAHNSFLFAVLFCCLGYFYRLDSYPPYFDYDSATEGIFLNNLTFQSSYDYGFSESKKPQDLYRVWYAAHRLPLSIPLSCLQKLFDVPPHNIDVFCKIVGGVFYLTGCLLAAVVIFRRDQPGSAYRMLFVAGGASVFPIILLGARTGMLFWGVLFCLYWLTLYCVFRHLETRLNRYLYGAAVFMAYFVLNPYPTLATLPLIIVMMAMAMKQFAFVLTNKHSYFALSFCVSLVVIGHVACARYEREDFQTYWQKVSSYRESRQSSISLEAQFFDVPITAKFKKLLNQELLFRRDLLGDRSRSDEVWTLGGYHYPWLVLSPLVLLGFLVSVRQGDRLAPIYGSVLIGTYIFFLTISFPEGRYLLAVVPCYFYFLQVGLEFLMRRELLSVLTRATVLFLLGGYTYYLVISVYTPYMEQKWFDRDGMKEIVTALPPHNSVEYIRLPHRGGNEEWLYFMMLSNFRAHWVRSEENSDAVFRQLFRQGTSGTFYYIDTPQAPRFPGYRDEGFEEIAQVVSKERKITFAILRKIVPSGAIVVESIP